LRGCISFLPLLFFLFSLLAVGEREGCKHRAGFVANGWRTWIFFIAANSHYVLFQLVFDLVLCSDVSSTRLTNARAWWL
jgi:hypothetical protein